MDSIDWSTLWTGSSRCICQPISRLFSSSCSSPFHFPILLKKNFNLKWSKTVVPYSFTSQLVPLFLPPFSHLFISRYCLEPIKLQWILAQNFDLMPLPTNWFPYFFLHHLFIFPFREVFLEKEQSKELT